MVKKRGIRKSSSRSSVRRGGLKRTNSVSNDNSINKNSSSIMSVVSSLKQMPITEKGLLIALLVFIGVVAFSTNGDKINEITGSFTEITGQQALNPASLSTRISGILNLITEGLLGPVFGLLSPTPNILFIKLILVIILYFIISFAGLGNMFGGKGKFIAGVISFFGVALLPSTVIDLYILQFIPTFLQFIFSLILVLFFIIIVHKIPAESRAGHGFKAILYFLLFILITGMDKLIVPESAITGVLQLGAFYEVAWFITTFAVIYSIVMIIVEIAKIFRGAPSAIASKARNVDSEDIGGAFGRLFNAPGNIKKGVTKGYRRERPLGSKEEKLEANKKRFEEGMAEAKTRRAENDQENERKKKSEISRIVKIAEKYVRRAQGDIASGNGPNLAVRLALERFSKKTSKMKLLTDPEKFQIFRGELRNKGIRYNLS